MAFLCPARKQRKRSKVKIRGSKPLDAPLMGRITGSDSIDTIDRVGLAKQRGNHMRMFILHNFEPCVDDELKVERGEEVQVLYQENDWLYVIAEDGREGFIPYTYGLPAQRSVDDAVVPTNGENNGSRTGSHVNVSKQRPSSAHVSNSYSSSAKKQDAKPSYQFATIGKAQNILDRSSSKSLPDLNDPSAQKLSNNNHTNHQRYPTDYNRTNGPVTKNNGFKDLTYGMSRDFTNLKATQRPRSLSYETQERKRAQYNRSVGGIHSQPTTPVKTSENVRNMYSFGTDYLSKSQPVSAGNHGYNYTTNAYSSVRLSRRDENEDRDYVDSLRRKDREEAEKRRPLNQSWGPSSGQKLQQLLQNSRSHQYTQHFMQHGNRQNYPSQNLLQIKQTVGPEVNSAQVSSFLTATNRNRTPLSSSSLFREESAKMSAYNAKNSNTADSSGTNKRGTNNVINKPRIEKFNKMTQGEYLVLYDFTAQQENDLTVERGEFVTVLNTEDKDWFWIRRSDHKEGFVPHNYLLNIDGQIQNSPNNNRASSTTPTNQKATGLNPGLQFATTERQPNWPTTATNQQSTFTQPGLSNHNYHPSTSNNNIIPNLAVSTITANQQPLSSTIYHSTSTAANHRQPSFTTATGSNNNIRQNATATSSPRDLQQKESSFQQQISPIAAPNTNNSSLSPSIPIGATRLICLYDYQAMTPDDLTVTRGQWLYADATQDDPDWLWVYSPSQSKAGYIPRTYAKPPSSW